jgi:hypothetical protein
MRSSPASAIGVFRPVVESVLPLAQTVQQQATLRRRHAAKGGEQLGFLRDAALDDGGVSQPDAKRPADVVD